MEDSYTSIYGLCRYLINNGIDINNLNTNMSSGNGPKKYAILSSCYGSTVMINTGIKVVSRLTELVDEIINILKLFYTKYHLSFEDVLKGELPDNDEDYYYMKKNHMDGSCEFLQYYSWNKDRTHTVIIMDLSKEEFDEMLELLTAKIILLKDQYIVKLY